MSDIISKLKDLKIYRLNYCVKKPQLNPLPWGEETVADVILLNKILHL